MAVELQSKGTYVFAFLNDSGMLRQHSSYSVDTISMDKFVESCTRFDTTDNGKLVLEWNKPGFSTQIRIMTHEDQKPGIIIYGHVKNSIGYLSNFKIDATKFSIMDRAWFFSNDKNTIRIFENGTIWLDDELGYFVIAPQEVNS